MDKRGAMQLKADNDVIAYRMATKYLATLAGVAAHKIILYRTDRGADYGVVVNVGEKVSVWNALREKVEHYNLADFHSRLLPVKEIT